MDSALDAKILKARQELLFMQQKRQFDTIRREKTLRRYQDENHSAQEALEERLKTQRPSISFIMSCLKEYYSKTASSPCSALPPTYVLQQETSLISALLYSETCLGNQLKMLENHQEEMEQGLLKERVNVFLQFDEINQKSLERVTTEANMYSATYDNYQVIIKGQEDERRKLLSDLSKNDKILEVKEKEQKDLVTQEDEEDDASTLLGCSDSERSLSDGSFDDDDDDNDDDSDEVNRHQRFMKTSQFNNTGDEDRRFGHRIRRLRAHISTFRSNRQMPLS